MKSTKKPLPAPRSCHMSPSIEEDKPPVPVRPRKHKQSDNSLNTVISTSDSIQSIEELRQFAIRKNFTDSEFNCAIQRITLPVDINYFLSQLIAVRAQGPININPVRNEPMILPKAKEIQSNLRNIVIDGSNIAMTYGNKGQYFSSKGIQIAVEWFRQRGHPSIKVFIPHHRIDAKRGGNRDVDILHELAEQGIILFTPSRESSNGSLVTCYDDRFILQHASEYKAIVVSNDKYKDLIGEDPNFRETIKHRLLMYMFAGDQFIPAEDPMGRKGPTLDQFLRIDAMDTKTGNCPYGRKCTYGVKCRYAHPERDDSAILEDTQSNISLGSGEYNHRPTPQIMENNNIKSATPTHTMFHHNMSATYSTEMYKMAEFSNHPSNISSLPVLMSRSVGDSEPSDPPPRTNIQKPAGPQKIVLKIDNGSIYQRSNTMMPHVQQRPHSLPCPTMPRNTQNAAPFHGVHHNMNQCTEGMSNMIIRANGSTSYNGTNMTNSLHMYQHTGQEFMGPANNSDTRYRLYFHLKHLFGEDKVREAMRRLPKETDARVIIEEINQIT